MEGVIVITQDMDGNPPLRKQPSTCFASATGALAILLHPARQAAPARELARLWGSRVPSARVSTLSLREYCCSQVEDVAADLASRLRRAAVLPSRLVLAAVCGAEDSALQLIFGDPPFPCVGLLVCGEAPMPLAPLSTSRGVSQVKLRLVWSRVDPLSGAAALGGLLECFRMVGIDAQGGVVGTPGESSAPGCELSAPQSPIARLGGAYFVELMAFAAPPDAGRIPRG